MKRCSIIIHSVTGNNYIIAFHLKSILEESGIETRLYRVEDADLHIFANKLETSNEYYEELQDLPVVTNEKLTKSNVIVLGCPTYFANMSAEMKTFIDGTIDLYESDALEGKHFACFTSCGGGIEDGQESLASMRRWAEQMKMIEVDAADLIHVSGEEGRIRPSLDFGKDIEEFASSLMAVLN